MATTFVDQTRNKLTKKYKTLIGKLGMNKEAELDMLWNAYKVGSVKELAVSDIISLCNELDLQTNPELLELDKRRKRLIAAIGGWLKALHMQSDISRIKAIACRASKAKSFNQIPLEKLRSLAFAFSNMQKDLTNVTELTAEMLDYLGQNN